MEIWETRGDSGYDARTRQQVKRVILFSTVNVCAYIEKGVKNSKIWQKVCFTTLEIVICVLSVILTADIKIKRLYLTTRCITYLFRVAKSDKNTCLGCMLFSWWK